MSVILQHNLYSIVNTIPHFDTHFIMYFDIYFKPTKIENLDITSFYLE